MVLKNIFLKPIIKTAFGFESVKYRLHRHRHQQEERHDILSYQYSEQRPAQSLLILLKIAFCLSAIPECPEDIWNPQ